MRFSRVLRQSLAALLAVLFFAAPAPVNAAGELGSITIQSRYNDVIPLAGDVYSLICIAAATVDESGRVPRIHYETVPAFEDFGYDWESLYPMIYAHAEVHKAVAGKLHDAVIDQIEDYETDSKTLNANGETTFSDLSPGIYLVTRKTTAAGNEDYATDPVLLSTVRVTSDGSVSSIDVLAKPKVEIIPPDPPPTTEPNTEPNTEPTTEPATPRPRRPSYNGRYYYDPNDPASGNPTTQITSPTAPLTQFPPGTPPTSQLPPTLPQTGQLKWPIPLLIVLGVVAFLTGFELRYGGRKLHDKK